MKMKILILVLSAGFEPYITLTKIIKETWASSKLPGIEILFYYGNSSIQNTEEDLYFDVEESLNMISKRTLLLFKYIKDFDFDYIFRTNSSSYINQSNLLKFLESKDRQKFYYGPDIPYGNFSFAAGSGYFLSKDLVNLIVSNKYRWPLYLQDDVALGKFMFDSKIELKKDSNHPFMVYDEENGNMKEIDSEILDNHYHYRCLNTYTYDRMDDIRAMKKLQELYKQRFKK